MAWAHGLVEGVLVGAGTRGSLVTRTTLRLEPIKIFGQFLVFAAAEHWAWFFALPECHSEQPSCERASSSCTQCQGARTARDLSAAL